MTTEEFIVDAAKRGMSKEATRQVLGVSQGSFTAMLEAMPPLKWPAKGQSITERLGQASRHGYCSDAQRAALAKVHAKRTERASYTVDGRKGTIEQLVKHYDVSSRTVRRRMKAGMGIKEALTTPTIPFHLVQTMRKDRRAAQ